MDAIHVCCNECELYPGIPGTATGLVRLLVGRCGVHMGCSQCVEGLPNHPNYCSAAHVQSFFSAWKHEKGQRSRQYQIVLELLRIAAEREYCDRVYGPTFMETSTPLSLLVDAIWLTYGDNGNRVVAQPDVHNTLLALDLSTSLFSYLPLELRERIVYFSFRALSCPSSLFRSFKGRSFDGNLQRLRHRVGARAHEAKLQAKLRAQTVADHVAFVQAGLTERRYEGLPTGIVQVVLRMPCTVASCIVRRGRETSSLRTVTLFPESFEEGRIGVRLGCAAAAASHGWRTAPMTEGSMMELFVFDDTARCRPRSLTECLARVGRVLQDSGAGVDPRRASERAERLQIAGWGDVEAGAAGAGAVFVERELGLWRAEVKEEPPASPPPPSPGRPAPPPPPAFDAEGDVQVRELIDLTVSGRSICGTCESRKPAAAGTARMPSPSDRPPGPPSPTAPPAPCVPS